MFNILLIIIQCLFVGTVPSFTTPLTTESTSTVPGNNNVTTATKESGECVYSYLKVNFYYLL